MKTSIRHAVRRAWVAPLVAVLLVAGCSRVTPENYEKVKAGMTRDEVHAILGKPDEVSSGGFGKLEFSSETWKGRKQTIVIRFGNDKVMIKSLDGNEAPAQ